MTLFDAVTGEQMRQAQIVTGVALAAFIGVSVVPGLRQYASRIRLALLAVYLMACGVFVAWQLLR
jgi:undecaprenyl pyrophosphate phosphatase UppP